MRKLIIDNKWDNWKFGDTNAIMTFEVADDGQIPDFTNKTLTFKIAGTSNNMAQDYVASAPGYVSGTNVILKTSDISTLTPGTYAVELWAMDNDTQNNAVYPSESFAFFTIDESTMQVTDINNVPSKTLQAVYAELMQKVGSIKKGDPGDPGETPTLMMGSVAEINSNQQPSASLEPSPNDPNSYTLNMQIPQGQPGKDADTSNLVTVDAFNGLQQEVTNKTNANQDYIVNYLSQMNLTPETFPNANDIQTTYPNGKAGIFVATDTGHKWIYYQGKWADAGIYQGVGVADRSLESKMTKQFDTLYRVVQAQPMVIDWNNHQLIIGNNISLMEGKLVVSLPVGTYTWDAKLVTVYCGFNAAKQQFDFVDTDHINDLPDDDYFIGIFDTASKMISSPFKATESTSVWHDGTKTLIQNNMLPPLQQAVCTAVDDDIHIDFSKRTLTLYNPINLYSKTHSLTVQPDTFTLNAQGLASFIYVTWSDNSNKYVLEAAAGINDVPENSWYLGWIDYYHVSSYFNQIGTNSTNKLKRANLTVAGKITVDFDTQEIVFPRNFDGFNFNLSLPKDYQNPVRVPLKASDGMKDNSNVYYISVDPKNADHLEISSDYTELSYNCQIIGWTNLSAKYYDFKEYGSVADLASQPFIGKKVTCLGDSITAGGMTDVGKEAISYAGYLETLIGTNPTNAGVSGSHITKGTAGRTDSFAERVDSINGQDLVTIYGGVNDFLFDSPLGAMTDEDTTQTTFYGALKYLVTRLTLNNPDTKLLFITPMKADKYGGTYDANGNARKNNVNATEEDYVNAIKEVASYYSIPVLDLFNNGNLNPYIPAQNAMTVDGLHPNEKGAQRLAKTIAHAINNL